MKQNVKVNTPIHIRPASYEEAGLFYSQMKETEDAALGTVGHVRMDFGSSGKGFYRDINERVVCTTMQYKPLAVSIIISKSSAKGELRPFAGPRGGSS